MNLRRVIRSNPNGPLCFYKKGSKKIPQIKFNFIRKDAIHRVSPNPKNEIHLRKDAIHRVSPNPKKSPQIIFFSIL